MKYLFVKLCLNIQKYEENVTNNVLVKMARGSCLISMKKNTYGRGELSLMLNSPPQC